MKKIYLVMLSVLVFAVSALAQNVDEGIKQLYYQKYNTAKQTLQNAVNANSKDARAIYWLGQALLAKDDIAGAKALYQKALNEGVNDPLIMVGVAHTETLEGKKNEARQHFEAAISSSMDRKKNPNPEVLNAIGRANADGSSTVGDPIYAVEKLLKAAELDKTTPDIYINLGINYLKMGSEKGGDAVQAFQNALQRNPKYAQALYRIGKIYESQQNKELFEKYYGEAVVADPAYSPVYLAFFDYYKNRDVNAAKEFLDKYIANAEQNSDNEFYRCDYFFRAGKYRESLDCGKALEAKYGLTTLPRLNVLYAYNYERLGDSLQAKAAIEKYLNSGNLAKVQAEDYVLAASVLAKFPGSEAVASSYFEKAIEMDTIAANRATYMSQAAEIFEKANKPEQQYIWYLRMANTKAQWSEADHYKLNNVSRVTKAWKRIYDTLAPKYVAAFPDKPQPYVFWVAAAKALDTAATLGLAVEPINKQNEFFMKDTAKYKKSVYSNYYYLLVHYAEKTKDLAKALEITEKMKALYPAGTEEYNFAEATGKTLRKTLDKQKGKSSTGGANNPGSTKTTSSSGASGGSSKAEASGKTGVSNKKKM
jgi:Tfp pilus assembly protein PilF